MEPKWIENQAKAIADYASIKYEGLHSEAHDHLMLYVEDVLREAQERAIPDEPTDTNHLRGRILELGNALSEMEMVAGNLETRAKKAESENRRLRELLMPLVRMRRKYEVVMWPLDKDEFINLKEIAAAIGE